VDECRYRSEQSVGTVYCGCDSGHREVWRCHHPEIDAYVTLRKTSVRRREVKLHSGARDQLPQHRIGCCVLCRRREPGSAASPDPTGAS